MNPEKPKIIEANAEVLPPFLGDSILEIQNALVFAEKKVKTSRDRVRLVEAYGFLRELKEVILPSFENSDLTSKERRQLEESLQYSITELLTGIRELGVEKSILEKLRNLFK